MSCFRSAILLHISKSQLTRAPAYVSTVFTDVTNLRVEGIILDRAEAEEHVALVNVEPQRIHGGDDDVQTDVELVAVYEVRSLDELLYEGAVGEVGVMIVDQADAPVIVQLLHELLGGVLSHVTEKSLPVVGHPEGRRYITTG